MASPVSTAAAAAFSHNPVLLKEVLHYMSPITALTSFSATTQPVGGRRRQPLSAASTIAPVRDTSAYTFVDATFGGGGYTRALLDTFPGSKVIAIDQDPAAIGEARKLAEKVGEGRVIPVRGMFGDMSGLLERELGMSGPCVDGVVFDIGVSSYQIDQGYRGFSWRADGPLDMRMCADKLHGPKFDEMANSSLTAEFVVNTYSEVDLANLIYQYGEEKKSRRIARAIVNARELEPIKTTAGLASVVVKGAGKYFGAIHPATRTFQALRIYVNDELNQFKQGLLCAETLLKPHGTLVGVTFHSLEDRLLKSFLRTTSGVTKGLGLRYYKESGRNGYKGIENYRRKEVNEVGNIAAMERAFEQDSERLRMQSLLEQQERFNDASWQQQDAANPSFSISTKKAVVPGDEEVHANVRARSAKLRAGVRTENGAMGHFDQE
ncbi:hypothetical protein HDU98_002859 [Podochytrium sp. JEL0797]|nr:hypothetical protein HDU98_002859 [Podochytrium sp. JEL0797]